MEMRYRVRTIILILIWIILAVILIAGVIFAQIYLRKKLGDRLKRETVDMNLIHAVMSSRDGGQKGVRGEFRVFMNQVDDDTDRLAAAFRLQQIFAVLGIQSAWGSLLEEPEIAVILEAAGNSSRFGSNKLLHIMEDGRPMSASILEAARSVDAYRKILVTQYDEVAAMAPDFKVVMNDRPDLGISRSMQLGLKAAGDADAYMFQSQDFFIPLQGRTDGFVGRYRRTSDHRFTR